MICPRSPGATPTPTRCSTCSTSTARRRACPTRPRRAPRAAPRSAPRRALEDAPARVRPEDPRELQAGVGEEGAVSLRAALSATGEHQHVKVALRGRAPLRAAHRPEELL